MDLTNLEAALNETQSHHPSSLSTGLSVIIPLPDEQASKNVQYSEQQATLKACEELLTGFRPPSVSSLKPDFLRLAPPLHVAEDEYIWLDPIEQEKFVPLFDKDMLLPEPPEIPRITTEATVEDPGSSEDEVDPMEVLRRGMETQLSIKEANWMVDHLPKAHHSLLHKVGMTPQKLPNLVDKNPMVAVEVILKLRNSEDLTVYFLTLINMELTVQGLEVVNRLATQCKFPEEILHLYVRNCMAACEGLEAETSGQNRLVRLVCVFLQALIRNKVINIKVLFVELQRFCTRFMNFKEAASLFRMVQALNAGTAVDDVDAN